MSVAGTWNITMNTPMGAQKATLTVAVKGTELTGSMSGPQGAITLKDGKADGDKGTWKADLTQPMPITLEFAATAEGNNISGSVKLGGFGNASFSGTRA